MEHPNRCKEHDPETGLRCIDPNGHMTTLHVAWRVQEDAAGHYVYWRTDDDETITSLPDDWVGDA